MTIGRRTVLRGLAVPLAWTFGIGSARAFWRREVDVLVVGAGGAGLAAAVAAAEEGASVLVLEKEEAIGGNTLRASGLFNAADPERQGPMGVEDSVAWHAEQTIESGGGRNDPDVVRRFAEEALPTIHWLEGMGIRFLPETQTTWGAEWPRGHKPFLPRGSSYIRTLSGKLLESGGEIRTKTALRDLLRDERGRITGVVTTEGVEIRAKCVVLASGGYGANPNLLKRWAPDWAKLPTDNAPGSTGDGQLAAERAGAALVNLDVVQAVPGVRKGQTHAVRLDLDVGACILVDARGERLVEEDGSRRALALAIRNAVGGRAYTVTDDRGVSSYDLVSQKDIYRGLQTGDAFRAETLEALALSGAFDCFEDISREDFFEKNAKGETFSEVIMRYGQKFQFDKQSQVTSLFGGDEIVETSRPAIPHAPKWPNILKLEKERELVGMYLSAHPLDPFYVEIEYGCNTRIKDLKDKSDMLDKELSFGGIVVGYDVKPSKRGTNYGILKMEDYSGTTEFFLFGNNFINYGKFGVIGTPIMVRGAYQKNKYNGRVDFNITSIELLENVKGKLLRSITMKLPEAVINASLVNMLKSYLTQSTENRSDLYFVICDERNHRNVQLLSRYKIPITRQLINKLNSEEINFTIN